MTRDRDKGNPGGWPHRCVINLMICLMAVCCPALAQELPQPLIRDRVLDDELEVVWSRMQRLLVQSDAIINAIDPDSHLVSMTLPVRYEEIRRTVIEAEDMPSQQAQTAHIVIWAQPAARGKTRLFIRAAIGSSGIFVHSNSAMEKDLFEAIESGKAWRAAKPIEATFDHPRERVWTALLNALKDSKFTLNLVGGTSGALTCTVDIASYSIQQYVAQPLKGRHPGSAHFTLWLEAVGRSTRVSVHSLLLEAGSYAPPALPSNGKLETQILQAVAKRLTDATALLDIGTSYQRAEDFWSCLFHSAPPEAEAIKKDGSRRHLPTSFNEAWTATIIVISQSAVISHCNRQAGQITYVVAHSSRSGSKFSAHQMSVLLRGSDLGVEFYTKTDGATESIDELAFEKQDLIDKIATQLFIKENLKWLLRPKEEAK